MNILNLSDKGNDVKLWQNFLILQGFNVKADGDFGRNTEKATRNFQAKHNLKADGAVGKNTLDVAVILGFATTIVEKPIATPSPSHLAMFGGSKIEQINAAKLSKVSPVLQQRGKAFIDAASADGVEVQIVQGLRTFSEQDAIYAQGRSRPGKRVTNARGGQSLHNYGLALDLAPLDDDGQVSWDEKLYKPFGKWAKLSGLEWGGDWRNFVDLPHVQDDEGMTLAEIQGLYRGGGLAAVWARIK